MGYSIEEFCKRNDVEHAAPIDFFSTLHYLELCFVAECSAYDYAVWESYAEFNRHHSEQGTATQ